MAAVSSADHDIIYEDSTDTCDGRDLMLERQLSLKRALGSRKDGRFACMGCNSTVQRNKLRTIRWNALGTFQLRSMEVQLLHNYFKHSKLAYPTMCPPCYKNVQEVHACLQCGQPVHRKQFKTLDYVYGRKNYWCRMCDSKDEVIHRCAKCHRDFRKTHVKRVCMGLHSSTTKCGDVCGSKEIYVCTPCKRKLEAIYTCTCCHRQCIRKNVVEFDMMTYDMSEYNVAAALHTRHRIKIGDCEYICTTCHSCLVCTDGVGPMMPRAAVARKSEGPGEEFLRAIREKPEFVCTCCHRWRFYRSVMRFDSSKYNFTKVAVQDALAPNMRYKMKVPVFKGERCPHIHRIPYDIYDTLIDDSDSEDECMVEWNVGFPEKQEIEKDEEQMDTQEDGDRCEEPMDDSVIVPTKPMKILEVEYICATCHRYLMRKKPIIPPMACANNLKLEPVPRELQRLSTLERALVAQRIPFMSIFIMRKYGSHYKIRGGCTNVPTRLEPIVKVLPRLSSEVRYHPMKLKRKLSFKSNYMYNWIHKQRVVEALEWLIKNNPLYKDVRKNSEWFDDWLASDLRDLVISDTCTNTDEQMDIEGVRGDSEVCHDKAEMSTDDDSDDGGGNNDTDISGYDDRTPEEIEQDRREVAAKLKLHGTPWANMLQKQTLEDEVVSCAPGENMHPTYVLMDEHFEEMAFPDLFPYGRGGYNSTSERRTRLQMRQYMQQRVLNVDGRFGGIVDYLFCAQYATDIKQLQGNTYLALRLNRGKTLDGRNVTAGMLRNAKELQRLARTEQTWKVLKTVRGSPAYWQNELYQLLAMLRSLGKPTFFITLSAADLHWREMLEATAVQKGKRYSMQDIRNMTVKDRADHLKGNPAIAAWMFQYRVECFEAKYLKHPSNPLGKLIDSVFKIEFQQRGAPHVHGLLWIEGAPRVDVDSDESVVRFIDRHISGAMPTEGEDVRYMRCLVKKFQLHKHSTYCRKHHICRFGFPQAISPHTLIAREWPDEENRSEKHKEAVDVLHRVLQVIDEEDDNATLDVLLERASVSQDVYCAALAVAKRGSTVILQRQPQDVCVNPFNPDILRNWGANMDLQYVVDEYSTVMYVCSYMMKSEKEMGEVLKSVSRECASEPVKGQLRKIGKAFIGTRVVSAPEAAMRLMSLWYIKKTREMRYIDANIRERRVSLPKPLYLLQVMEDDDENIYMTNVHDRYSHRPDQLEDMCLMEFANTYDPLYAVRDDSLDTDERYVDNHEQLTERDEDETHCEVIKLKGGYGHMRKRKKCTVPLVKVYRESVDAEAYYHARLILYYPWRDEAELLGMCTSYSDSYEEKKGIVESHAAHYNLDATVLDEAIERLATEGAPESAWDRMAPGAQQNDAAVVDAGADEVTNTAEMTDSEKTALDLESPSGVNTRDPTEQHALSQLYERVARKDRMEYKKYRELVRGLNPKQRAIVMYNRLWCKQWIRAFLSGLMVDGYKLFLSGAGGTGKSYVIQLIQRDMLHLLIPIKKPEPDQPLVLLTAPTGTAAFNIDGTTIHSSFALDGWSSKQQPGTSKGSEQKWVAENKLAHLMLLVIDEVSMVGYSTFQQMSTILQNMRSGKDRDWGGACMLAVGDLMQLDPIQQKPPYRDPTVTVPGDMAPLLWDDLMFHELDEAMRQTDQPFRDMLNRVRMEKPAPNSAEEMMLRSRELQISHDDQAYPQFALHVYARNVHCDTWNNIRLDGLPGTAVEYHARDKTRDVHTRLVDVQFPPNPSHTGNLRGLLRLKVGARVMLTTNIDVSDGLTNGAMGKVVHLSRCGKEILVKFDNERIGQQAAARNRHPGFPGAVAIRRREASFTVKGHRSVRVSRLQFPLMLSWAVTIHKVQGATLPEIVVDMQWEKGNFSAGMAYVAFSRVRSLENLYILNYDHRQIIVNQRAAREMRREGKQMVPAIPRPYMLLDEVESHLKVAHLNVQNILAKMHDICCSEELRMADIVCLTETHLDSENFMDVQTLGLDRGLYEMFRLDRDRHGGGIMLCVRRTCVPVQLHFEGIDGCEFLVICITLAGGRLHICYVYKPPKQKYKRWLKNLHVVLEQLGDGAVCILGDMNENLLDKESPKPIHDDLTGHGFCQHVVDATTDYGSLLDHMYTRNVPSKAVTTEILDCYYSDHDIMTSVISSTFEALPIQSARAEFYRKHFPSKVDPYRIYSESVAIDDQCDMTTPDVKKQDNRREHNGTSAVRRKLVFEASPVKHDECALVQKMDGEDLPADIHVKRQENLSGDVRIVGDITYEHGYVPAIPVYFLPLKCEDRAAVSMKLALESDDGVYVPLQYKGEGKYCGRGKHCGAVPKRSKSACAIPDGNCLFRSFSYLLFGHQRAHEMIRSLVCAYIMSPANWVHLRPYIREYGSGVGYIHASHMDTLKEWGTEVELFAFAQLTRKDVVVYAYNRWLIYCSSGSSQRRSLQAFYLNNATGKHFDPVVAVV